MKDGSLEWKIVEQKHAVCHICFCFQRNGIVSVSYTHLEDIADVRIGPKAPKLGTASERGKPAVLMTVTKQPATSTLELTDKLETSLQDLRKNLPPDVKVSTDIFRQSRFIDKMCIRDRNYSVSRARPEVLK